MNTELGRVQIIQGTPPNLPGKCIMCGTTEGPFIDIGFDIDFYGTMYWCFSNCFREVANVLEYYSPDQVDSIKREYDELVKHNSDLYDENKELRSALDAITSASKFVTTISDTISVNVVESKSTEQSTTDSTEVKPKSTRRKERSTEQINESGSSSIQHDDSLTELLGFNI